MNILTFDIEEWFHLLDFDATRTEHEWDKFEVRIYDNVERILGILEDTDTRATFFIIGWIARRYPDVVRRISEKYQIGCHTMRHQLVWQQTPEEFRRDVETGVKTLEDITGKKVECFRAPGFSIHESEAWAFEVLNDLGIKYDCSVFPALHAHGGMPSYPKDAPGIIHYNGVEMKEFPVSFKNIAGRHVVFSGGGYFRFFPLNRITKWTKQRDYNMCYFHTQDFDTGQPNVSKDLPLARRFKTYYGIKGAFEKFKSFLDEFEFVNVREADKMIEWKERTLS